ncbi:hypothetical protein [Streptomyces sp. NPDC048606]|uniref:hypothetical protein n=1 Tax=Streptomyces sp. NPDC048606 TaxID=3154726 RepID=UPI003437460C
MTTPINPYTAMDHPFLRRRVRDIACGAEGELMAVVREKVGRHDGQAFYATLAYIRMKSGREFSTAVTNIEAA